MAEFNPGLMLRKVLLPGIDLPGRSSVRWSVKPSSTRSALRIRSHEAAAMAGSSFNIAFPATLSTGRYERRPGRGPRTTNCLEPLSTVIKSVAGNWACSGLRAKNNIRMALGLNTRSHRVPASALEKRFKMIPSRPRVWGRGSICRRSWIWRAWRRFWRERRRRFCFRPPICFRKRSTNSLRWNLFWRLPCIFRSGNR